MCTILGKMTDADKIMHPQHFGIDLTDIHIGINVKIQIRIPYHFCFKFWHWWRFVFWVLLFASVNSELSPRGCSRALSQLNWEGCGKKGIWCQIWGGTLGSLAHLCSCCKPTSGHRVRGESGRVPATNQGPLKLKKWWSFSANSSSGMSWEKGHTMVVVAAVVLVDIYCYFTNTHSKYHLQDGSSCSTNLRMNIFPGIANVLHKKDKNYLTWLLFLIMRWKNNYYLNWLLFLISLLHLSLASIALQHWTASLTKDVSSHWQVGGENR